MIGDIKKDAEQRMHKCVDALKDELKRMRTGRAHAGLLESVRVEYYGTQVPIKQTANITVEDARTLVVTPWEKNIVSAVEKAILNAGLGLNPVTAGTVIRVPLPPMTEERRKDLVKVVRHSAENGRVAIRAVRRDALTRHQGSIEGEDDHGGRGAQGGGRYAEAHRPVHRPGRRATQGKGSGDHGDLTTVRESEDAPEATAPSILNDGRKPGS